MRCRHKSHNLLSLILALLFDIMTALPDPQVTAQNVSASPTDEKFQCFDGHTFHSSQLASTKNCLGASFFLPLDHQEGQFHAGNDNVFGLDWHETIGDCTIKVSIEDGHTELTTWTSIALRVNQLIGRCTNGNFPDGKTGGLTKAGVGQTIILTIGKSEQYDATGGSENGNLGTFSVAR